MQRGASTKNRMRLVNQPWMSAVVRSRRCACALPQLEEAETDARVLHRRMRALLHRLAQHLTTRTRKTSDNPQTQRVDTPGRRSAWPPADTTCDHPHEQSAQISPRRSSAHSSLLPLA
uniref:Uncharacterized protein n=1 Tax=Chrysotila carterae TaxID=13221 RepID=A0A7S4EWQ8_CHRCT|eukprot:6190609-Pleurochrysis_carterae.AAC.4